MRIREATKADILYVADHSASRGCFKDQPDQIDYIYTLEHEGDVLGIGGIKIINPTTAWCWVDVTVNGKKHMIMAYRTLKVWIDKLVEIHGLRRLMAAVGVDFPEAIRMIEHLGFVREYTMEQWSGDKPAHLYGRIF